MLTRLEDVSWISPTSFKRLQSVCHPWVSHHGVLERAGQKTSFGTLSWLSTNCDFGAVTWPLWVAESKSASWVCGEQIYLMSAESPWSNSWRPLHISVMQGWVIETWLPHFCVLVVYLGNLLWNIDGNPHFIWAVTSPTFFSSSKVRSGDPDLWPWE